MSQAKLVDAEPDDERQDRADLVVPADGCIRLVHVELLSRRPRQLALGSGRADKRTVILHIPLHEAAQMLNWQPPAQVIDDVLQGYATSGRR